MYHREIFASNMCSMTCREGQLFPSPVRLKSTAPFSGDCGALAALLMQCNAPHVGLSIKHFVFVPRLVTHCEKYVILTMDSIVARPKSTQTVSSLVQEIQQASIALSTSKDGIDESSRKTTLSLAKELVAALENPEDVVMRYVFEVWPQLFKLLIDEF